MSKATNATVADTARFGVQLSTEVVQQLDRLGATIKSALGRDESKAEQLERCGPQIVEARRVCRDHGVHWRMFTGNVVGGGYTWTDLAKMADAKFGKDQNPDQYREQAETIRAALVRANEGGREQLTALKDAGEVAQKVKDAMPHGQFMPWVEREFKETPQTVRNWMRLAEKWERIKAALDKGRIKPTLREALKLVAKRKKKSEATEPKLTDEHKERLRQLAVECGIGRQIKAEAVAELIVERLGFSITALVRRLAPTPDNAAADAA